MADPLRALGTRVTPQNRPAQANQVVNSAGGFSFPLDDLKRLRRFLTIGVAGGTYYADTPDKQVDLARENADVVIKLAQENPAELLAEITAISESGRAPKVQPTLFALAIAGSYGTTDDKRTALAALPRVARTGTHLLTFVKYVEQFRGWGPMLKRAVGNWYLGTDANALAYQVVKYRNRDGWGHRDALRLCHPQTVEPARRALFNWLATGDVTESRSAKNELRDVGATRDDLPKIVEGFERIQRATDARGAAQLIREYRLPWEAVPTQLLNESVIWETLLDIGVPQTALMRQLPRLTNLKLLPNSGGRTNEVVQQLIDPERLKKARVHPMNVLIAQRTYAQGHGMRGSLAWTPMRRIVDALDQAFYAAYGAVEPTGKRTLLALDVSGSMSNCTVAGLPITPREASAALALVTANVESDCEIVGFTSASGSRYGSRYDWRSDGVLTSLSISPRQRLDDAVRAVTNLPFGGTDCALPMIHARQQGLAIDTFVIYTDGETWAGSVHPFQALRQYREATGIPARVVICAMTSTGFTLADPNDAGMLDIAGLDSAVPTMISDFSRGDM